MGLYHIRTIGLLSQEIVIGNKVCSWWYWRKKWKWEANCICSGGAKGGARDAPPAKISLFSCSFRRKLVKSWVCASSSGKSWIRHWFECEDSHVLPLMFHENKGKYQNCSLSFSCPIYSDRKFLAVQINRKLYSFLPGRCELPHVGISLWVYCWIDNPQVPRSNVIGGSLFCFFNANFLGLWPARKANNNFWNQIFSSITSRSWLPQIQEYKCTFQASLTMTAEYLQNRWAVRTKHKLHLNLKPNVALNIFPSQIIQNYLLQQRQSNKDQCKSHDGYERRHAFWIRLRVNISCWLNPFHLHKYKILFYFDELGLAAQQWKEINFLFTWKKYCWFL